MLSDYAPALGPATFFATGLLGSFALAWVSYHTIELPFLHLKRFVSYGRESRPVESTASPDSGPLPAAFPVRASSAGRRRGTRT